MVGERGYLLGGFLGGLGRSHGLDNLLFFDQESADDSLTNTKVTSGSTVSTRDSSLSLLQRTHMHRAHILDPRKLAFAVTTDGLAGLLGKVLDGQLSTGSLNLSDLVRLGVVCLSTSVSYSLDHVEK